MKWNRMPLFRLSALFFMLVMLAVKNYDLAVFSLVAIGIATMYRD